MYTYTCYPPHNPPLSWPPVMGCMLNYIDVPADTRHRPNVGPPSTRWPSIGPTLGRCLVFSGKQSWQQVSVRSQCYVTLTALSRHWRDAGGAGNTRECDNSVDGPTLLSVASHHDMLSLTRVSPRWWVSDRPTNYYTIEPEFFKMHPQLKSHISFYSNRLAI